MLNIHPELRELLVTMRSHGDTVATTLLMATATTNAQGDYLAYKADDNQISYKPAQKIREDNATAEGRRMVNHYAARGRMVGRPARTVRKFISPFALEGLRDTDFEQFTNGLAAYQNYMGDIQIVSGDDIKYWYHEDRYMGGNGTLDHSCMQYGRCQTYFSIYTQNPDVCRMVIVTMPDRSGTPKLVGRALLWTTTDGTVVMDRVYGTDKLISYVRNWGREQGFAFRDSTKDIQLTNWKFGRYPYMDTFHYLNMKTGVLTDNWTSSCATLSGTHGVDWTGPRFGYLIPVIRATSPYIDEQGVAHPRVQIGYAEVSDVASLRGAQRRLTTQLGQYYQSCYVTRTQTRNSVRGVDPFTGLLWRKMTALEMRYFGMEPGEN